MSKVHTNPTAGNPYSIGNPQNIVPPGSQTRISCEPKVANNFDKLKISFWLDWEDESFLDQLESIKLQAQSGDDDSLPFAINGYEWNVHRSGSSRYNYRLTRGDVVILINRRKHDGAIPTARLEVGSMSCWSPGYREIYNHTVNMILDLGGTVTKERVSEVHLCVDVIGISINDLPVTIQDHWICRAHRFTPEYYRKKLTGVSLGKGNLMLRIYDKIEELKKDTEKANLFYSIWDINPFDNLPVTRVEFQIRRPTLLQFEGKINTLDNLEDYLDSLWSYCTCLWARLTQESVDRNHHQSRSNDHNFWILIQSTNWESHSDVIRQYHKLHKDPYKLGKQYLGLGMTLAALENCPVDDIDSISEITHTKIEEGLRSLYEENHHEFVKRMKRKQRWPRLFGQVGGENKVESLHGFYAASWMTGPA